MLHGVHGVMCGKCANYINGCLLITQVCQSVNIPLEYCHARLLPQEKLQWIIDNQQNKDGTRNGEGVIMLGDGINVSRWIESPAL